MCEDEVWVLVFKPNISQSGAACNPLQTLNRIRYNQGHHEGEDTFEERLAIVKQLHVGRFVLKIDGDGTVCSRRFGCCTHV